MRRQRILPKVSWITIKPNLQNLEDRLAPALIAPTPGTASVILQNGPAANGGVTINNQTVDYSNISVVADPTNPLNQYMTAQARLADGTLAVVGRFSNDAGETWTNLPGFGAGLSDHTAPFVPGGPFGAGSQPPFTDSSQASVGIGRDVLLTFPISNTTPRARQASSLSKASAQYSPPSPTQGLLRHDVYC
jgi:hypothetical protein